MTGFVPSWSSRHIYILNGSIGCVLKRTMLTKEYLVVAARDPENLIEFRLL